jgi:hypothetical protein
MVPDPIQGAVHTFFSSTDRNWLQAWWDRSGAAVTSRQAVVLESYEKARFNNLQNLRKMQKEATNLFLVSEESHFFSDCHQVFSNHAKTSTILRTIATFFRSSTSIALDESSLF